MSYILDTDICVYWLKGDEKIESKALDVGLDSLSISFITLSELYFGAHKSQKVKHNLLNVEKLRKKLIVIESSDTVCKTFGKIKVPLVKEGKIIDDADIFIAACALSEGVILVTNNEGHFKRIKGLKLENWLSVK